MIYPKGRSTMGIPGTKPKKAIKNGNKIIITGGATRIGNQCFGTSGKR